MEQRVAFAAEEAMKGDDVSKVGAVAGAVRGSALKVIINGQIEANIDVDTMASKSCMTIGMLEDLRLLIPIATQKLTKAVKFTLGDKPRLM